MRMHIPSTRHNSNVEIVGAGMALACFVAAIVLFDVLLTRKTDLIVFFSEFIDSLRKRITPCRHRTLSNTPIIYACAKIRVSKSQQSMLPMDEKSKGSRS